MEPAAGSEIGYFDCLCGTLTSPILGVRGEIGYLGHPLVEICRFSASFGEKYFISETSIIMVNFSFFYSNLDLMLWNTI